MPGNLYVKTLISNVNAYVSYFICLYIVTLYAFLYNLYTRQAFLLCPLIITVQSFQGLPQCYLSFQSWFNTYVLQTMIAVILDLNIHFGSLPSHGPYKLVSLLSVAKSARYQRGINAGGHSHLWKWSSFVCLTSHLFLLSFVIMWSVLCLSICSILTTT